MKKRVLILLMLISIFVISSCSNDTLDNKSSDLENIDIETKNESGGIFDDWEEIEVIEGSHTVKIDAVIFHGNSQNEDELVAFGKDNYMYERNYDETNNRYYYKKLYSYEVNDSLVYVKTTSSSYRYLIYEDSLIGLNTYGYLKKGKPQKINIDEMTLVLEINNKKVDVTWENNATVEDLKKRALKEFTIYLTIEDIRYKMKILDFELVSSISDFNITLGDVVLINNVYLSLYFDDLNKSVSDCTKICHINMSKPDLIELLSSKETSSLTFKLV